MRNGRRYRGVVGVNHTSASSTSTGPPPRVRQRESIDLETPRRSATSAEVISASGIVVASLNTVQISCRVVRVVRLHKVFTPVVPEEATTGRKAPNDG